MTDPYSILGVNKKSSDKEIKSAYRKLAMEHHPDKGGDQKRFQEITEAFEQIKTQHQRDNLYNSHDPFSQGGFNTRDDFAEFENAFNMHFKQRSQPRPNPNRDIHINYNITLDEVYDGVNKDIQIKLPGNQTTTVNIKIPKGIKSGNKIKFSGCGDNTYKGFTPGDLYVTVIEQTHHKYVRQENNCCVSHTIDVFTAMVGGEVEVGSIDGSKYKLKIKPGTQPGSRFRIPEAGFPIINTRKTGDLIIELKVKVPAIADTNTTIQDLKEENYHNVK